MLDCLFMNSNFFFLDGHTVHLQVLLSLAMQIGGSNLFDKAAALHTLASTCDGLVFVGMMAFQIMHALQVSVPLNLVEQGTLKDALDIIQFAQNRNVQILYPKDFWCKNDHHPKQLEIFPGHAIPDGETAFD